MQRRRVAAVACQRRRLHALHHSSSISQTARTPQGPPAALVLMAAGYEDATLVWLTFNRTIDIGALNGSAIVIDALIGPATVEILLTDVGLWAGPDLRLNAR